jgi:hypothetical protein
LVDWLNPETWKPAADLVSDWRTIGGAAILAGGAIWRWGAGLTRWLTSTFRAAKPVATVALAPERQLRFVVDDRSTFHTPIGSDEKTGTHVIGVWDVTNISDRAFVLLKVKLGGHASKSATVGVESSRDPSWVVKGPLRAHRMSRVRIELAFTPAIHVPGEDLIVDVIFTDNYEGEHRVLGVRFPRFTPRAS